MVSGMRLTIETSWFRHMAEENSANTTFEIARRIRALLGTDTDLTNGTFKMFT